MNNQAKIVNLPESLTLKEFKLFRELIYRQTGIALSDHKRALVYSRLSKRLRLHGLNSYRDYYDLLQNNDPGGVELMEMVNAITTNKTSFFRENHHFTFLNDHVFPKFREAAAKGRSKYIRMWSAGCSTGQEAYSIALSLLGAFPPGTGWSVKVLATDIDTNVLNKAGQGVYPIEQAEDIPSHYLSKYFFKGTGENRGCFRTSDELKNIIDFQKLNFLDSSWPIKGQFDIIFCRNVIIYFDKSMQQKLIKRFRQYLPNDGYLMLGHSESLHGHDTDLINQGKNIFAINGDT